MIVSVFLCSQAKEFSLEDRILLFGNSDIKEAFKELDRDDDGEVGTFLWTHLWVMEFKLFHPLSFSYLIHSLFKSLSDIFDGAFSRAGYQMCVVE